MADPITWQAAALAVGIAAMPVVAAWRAAVLARRSAERARVSQDESARLQRLEARVSGQKYEMYFPLIDVLGRLLTPGVKPSNEELLAAMTGFQTWAGIYASDGALRAFGRMMQGSFWDPPPLVMLRLAAEFMLEARKDMGDESTTATVEDILAPRVKDLYSSDQMAALLLPFDDLCERMAWVPPWSLAEIE